MSPFNFKNPCLPTLVIDNSSSAIAAYLINDTFNRVDRCESILTNTCHKCSKCQPAASALLATEVHPFCVISTWNWEQPVVCSYRRSNYSINPHKILQPPWDHLPSQRQHKAMVRIDLGTRMLIFKSQFHTLLAVWPWASYQLSLCPSFLIKWEGEYKYPLPTVSSRLNKLILAKCSKGYLTLSKYSIKVNYSYFY